MEKIKVLIKKDGTIKFIYNDKLAAFTQNNNGVIERASNVEPTATAQWEAKMKDGKVLGPFATRAEALQEEVKYIERQMFGHEENSQRQP